MRFPNFLTRLLVVGASALVFSHCGSDDPEPAPALYFPPVTGTWETRSPASLGWNTDAIPALEQFVETSETRALLVLKDGRIALEIYRGKRLPPFQTQNFDATSTWYWASAGKTLTSAMVGIAVAEGNINLDTKTSDYLGTGWTSLTPTQENRITVRHQLSMTSGLKDNVTNPDCTDPACLVFQAEPGTRWAYHNAPYTLLDGVIEQGTGKTLNTYANEKIMEPIGAVGAYVPTGDNNIFYSNARSMARFGLLLLANGQWQNTPIIPEAYVAEMITSSQTINPSYGYLTWLNGKPKSMIPGSQIVFTTSISPTAPSDMFAALGKNGQMICVVPSEKLVVIRMGDLPDNVLVPFTFLDDLWEELNKVIR